MAEYIVYIPSAWPLLLLSAFLTVLLMLVTYVLYTKSTRQTASRSIGVQTEAASRLPIDDVIYVNQSGEVYHRLFCKHVKQTTQARRPCLICCPSSSTR